MSPLSQQKEEGKSLFFLLFEGAIQLKFYIFKKHLS